MSRFLLLLVCGVTTLLTSAGPAQTLVTEAEVARITPSFVAPRNSLKCQILAVKPTLDFAARFESGYQIHCRSGLFLGQAADIYAYARVTPAGKAPTVLGQEWHFPAPDPAMLNGDDPRELKTDLELSGAFGVGSGDYSIEVLLTDNHARNCFKRWSLSVRPHRGQRKVKLSIDPLTVESLDPRWDLNSRSAAKGMRVTVLLNVAAIDPSSSHLPAADRTLLLEALYSLVREIPNRSIRVVAFSMERQQELFRQDNFDADGFARLSDTLSELETATISVEQLRERDSPRFLSHLVQKEVSRADLSDAIIFVGPSSSVESNPSARAVSGRKTGKPLFFYFEYYPWVGFVSSDPIQQLTKSLQGKTYLFHSPTEFGQNLQKMLTRLEQD